MSKKNNDSGYINVRWKIKESTHTLIATYQAFHKIEKMEVAANMFLEKAAEKIKSQDFKL